MSRLLTETSTVAMALRPETATVLLRDSPSDSGSPDSPQLHGASDQAAETRPVDAVRMMVGMVSIR